MKRWLLLIFLQSTYAFSEIAFKEYPTDDPNYKIEYSFLFPEGGRLIEMATLPLVLKISNHSKKKATWYFEANLETYTLRKRLSVEGLSSRTFTIEIPSFNRGIYHKIEISGSGIKKSRTHSAGTKNGNGLIASFAAYQKLKSDPSGKNYGYHLISQKTIQYFPDSWSSFTSLYRVLLTNNEFNTLRETQKYALKDWVLIGGILEIMVSSKEEREPLKNFFGLESLVKKNDLPYVLGSVVLRQPFESPNHFYTYTVRKGDNLSMIARDNRISLNSIYLNNPSLGGHVGHYIHRHYIHPGQKLNLPRASSSKLKAYHDRFHSESLKELWGTVKEPKISLILAGLLLGSFFCFIGPFNFYVLARKNRLRLLLYTPVIAFCASIVFFLTIIFYDGFGGEGMKKSFVWLSSKSNRCTITQNQIVKNRLMLRPSFKREGNYIINAYYKKPKSSRQPSQITDDGQWVSGDMFNSRSRRLITLKDIRATQASLEFIDGDLPSIRSNFQNVLKPIFIRTEDGRLFSVDQCSPGQTVPLKETSIKDLKDIKNESGRLFKAMRNHPLAFFVAEMSGDSEFDIVTNTTTDWVKHDLLIGGDLKKGKLQ